MKLLIACLLLVPLLVTACIPAAPQTNKGVVYAKSDLERDLEPTSDPGLLKALAADNTQFAFNFYDQINDGTDNIIFSPLSLSLALSMALAGAKGETRAEMFDALAISDLSDALDPTFNSLLLQVEGSQADLKDKTRGDKFQLNIANSIWGQAGFELNKDFLDTLARNYGAGIYSVDYVQDAEAAREAINQWVDEETTGKIPDLIPQGALDALTRLVLANAIYFKGSWMYEFNENGTKVEPFTLLDGSEKDVQMMHLYNEKFQYGTGEGYQMVRIPYLSSDFSMLVFVPDEGKFSEVEASLSAEDFRVSANTMSMEYMNLGLPKFDFESSISAAEVLKQLGMLAAFDPGSADFSGINADTELFISEVIHKATITVDEKGTEAAAATAIIMKMTSMPAEPIELTLDRPFMFAIEHQPTGTVLFMGRVVAP